MENNKKISDVQEEINDISPEEQDEIDAVSEYNDTASEISDMEEKLADMESKLAESEEKYLRLMAEYDNFRKRTAKEKTEAFGRGASSCIEQILPVVDSFERGVNSECTDEAYKNGMIMINNQLQAVLEKLDVKEVPALGEDFDPNVHNAISKADSDEYESGKICAVYQKGYSVNGKLLRPAMVAVAN